MAHHSNLCKSFKARTFAMVVFLSLSAQATAVLIHGTHGEETSAGGTVHKIRVAIYETTKTGGFYLSLLQNYQWKVGQTTYRFEPANLVTEEIRKGALTTKDFDVLVYSFNQADQYLLNSCLPTPKNEKIKEAIRQFVQDGGGYYGSCGAAAIAGGMTNTPTTALERAMKRNMLGISTVEMQYDTAIPLVTELFMRRAPESVDMQAFLLSSGWNTSNPHCTVFTGLCPNVTINTTHPVFHDFLGDTRKIRWIGMEGFELPQNPDREIQVLGRFPAEELSDNASNQAHYWTYTGGWKGIIKGILTGGSVNWCQNYGRIPMKAFLFSSDWKKTDMVMRTNVSSKIFMSAEIYPNGNEARIVRCSGHPELKIFWGGHLEDANDTGANTLYEGFYYVAGTVPFNQTVEDERTYNYCIIRRVLAWEAKIPDDDLPAVYGPSQVSDVSPYVQISPFTVTGNAEVEADRSMLLDLYYRYSGDNTSWGDWALYGTDANESDGLSWDFTAPQGPGFYQFYSIRRVVFDGYTEIETAPAGPDAIAHVV